MAVKVAELYETLELRDSKFKRSMRSAKKDSKGLSGILGGIGKVAVAGAAVAGAALAGAAVKGVSEFQKFDKQMNEVFTLMPKASEEAQKQMSDDLRKFSEEMGVTTDEAAPALYQAISAGVPKENVFTFMEQAQKSAVAGVTDLTTSVDALSSVVNTYGEENISAKEASDKMFTAVRLGKTTFGELSANMSDVAPIASSMGIEFSNITAALSTMTSQGTPTAKATTQLKQAMAELSKEGSKADLAFKKVAGESFQSFIDNGGNMQEAMALLQQAAEDNNTSVSNMFGSIEAGQAALALTGEGAQKFKSDLDEMNNSSGATEQAYQQMEKSLSRNMDKIKSAMEAVWLEVGEKLMPIMQKLTDWIIDNMPAIKETVGRIFDGVINSVQLGIDIFNEHLLPIIQDLTDWVVQNMPQIKKTIKTIFDGIVESVEIGIDIFNKVRDIAKRIFASDGETSKYLTEMYNTFSEIFNDVEVIINTFVDWAIEFWDLFGDDIIKIVEGAFNAIKIKIDTILGVVEGIIQAFKGLITGDWEEMREGLTKIWNSLWNGIKDTVENIWDNVLKKPVEDIYNGITGWFTDIKNDVLGSIQGMVEGITEWFGNSKLGKIIELMGDTSKGIIAKAKGLADILVGNSIIPDMVDGVIAEFVTMKTRSIEEAKKWADGVTEQAAELNKNLLKEGAYREANKRANMERLLGITDEYTSYEMQKEAELTEDKLKELTYRKSDKEKNMRELLGITDEYTSKEMQQQAEFTEDQLKELTYRETNTRESLKRQLGIVEDGNDDIEEDTSETWDNIREKFENISSTIETNMADTFERLITESGDFSDKLQIIYEGLGSVVSSVFSQMTSAIASALTESLQDQISWVQDTLANIAKAIVGYIQAAYAQLVAFYAWAGPAAPILAGGTIAVGMAALGALASTVMSAIGLEEGGLVTGATFAQIGEGSDDEAVIPLNRKVFTKLGEGIAGAGFSGGQITAKFDTQISILRDIKASLQGPRQININANYYVDSQGTAESANNDLVSKLQGRGLAGAMR